MTDRPDTRPDPFRERLKAYRHVAQCVLAEDRARQLLATTVEFTGPESASARTCQATLEAEGLRLDAALLALDEMLTARPPVAVPDRHLTNTDPRLMA